MINCFGSYKRSCKTRNCSIDVKHSLSIDNALVHTITCNKEQIWLESRKRTCGMLYTLTTDRK